MRNCAAGLVVVGFLMACQGPGDATSVETQHVKGGDIFIAGLESVCSMFVTLPPDDDDMAQDPIYCSCTKIGPGVVITAASCVEENLRADKLEDIDVRFGNSFDSGTQYAVDEVVVQRYYNPDSRSNNDLAMMRLDSDPPEPAAVVNTKPITTDDVGPATAGECSTDLMNMTDGCVVLAGFGETDNGVGDQGAKKKTVAPLRLFDRKTLSAGTVEQTTCDGDSGSPVFMDFGDGLVLVAVTSRQSQCSEGVTRTRLDPEAEFFIFPYVDRFGATCGLDGATCETGCPRTPDPDCDDCSWNDVCKEDCPTRDLDCEIGVFPGNACTQSGECELRGTCIPADDDPTFTYCSDPCDPADDVCTGDMTCQDNDGTNQCTWPLPSPGSQGAECATNLDCRSGICEELICVTECDPGAADPCPTNHANPDQPFTCGPSTVADGTNVCLGVIFSGGGGFCAVDAADPQSPVKGDRGRGLLVLLGLVGLALVVRRRRA